MLSLIEKIIFGVTLIGAVYFALQAFGKKLKLIKQGQPIQRFDNPGGRIAFMIKRVFLQICAYSRRPVPGFFHSMIFWGFLVFVLVTLNHVAEGFVRGASLLGHGTLYKAVIFAANIFSGMILLSVIFFAVRRYIFKPSSLEIPSYESLIILTFITLLMVSFLFFEALRMVHHPLSKANFLAILVHDQFLPATMSAGTVLFWEKFLWWIHTLVLVAFGVFIPYSKHLHLIAGPANIVLKNNGVLAEIPTVNLEEQEKFGTPVITDLTQKDLLDLFSCAECGRCDDVCPTYNTSKDLSPKTLLHKLKEHLMASWDTLKNGTPENAAEELKTLFAQVISENEVWDCTTCGACMAACPMFNEHIAKIMGMRQYAVLMESNFPEEYNNLYRSLENQGNPWGIGAQARSEWAEGLDVPLMSEKGEAEVLLWVGCEGSYDSHNQKNTQLFVRILQKAGVDFAYLGNDEKCCGDPARRSGHEYLYQMLAMENIENLNNAKFKRIVTMCPHGYHMLKNEYSRMGGNYDVVHYADFMLELVEQGKIKLKPEAAKRLTFHDPCYLGRYNNIYDGPRQLLKRLTGESPREMKRCKETSFCCGGGGGGMWKEESKGDRISHARIKQAADTGAEAVVTACPYCSLMFKDAIDETGTENLRTMDLVQLVHENME